MKTISLIFLMLALSVSKLSAQARLKLDEKAIVKDSTGKIYNFVEWKALCATGTYDIKVADNQTEFLLFTNDNINYNKLPISSRNSSGEVFNFGRFVTLDGKKYKPSDFENKIVVINFWFINCAPCRLEIPLLNKLKNKFQENDNIVFLAFALDGRESLEKFITSQKFNYQIIPDSRSIAQLYDINSFPTNLVVNNEGKIVASYAGFSQNYLNHIERTINNLLK